MSETAGAARLLRQLREERGRSLRSAADDLGVAPSHLSRWERGEKAPSGDLLKRAAHYYGVDEEIMALDAGRVPDDVILLLQQNPYLLNEIRRRFAQ
ncbi:helix-turn-helix domain-containing protein [Cellulomonas sp. NPDC055163]